MDKKVKKIHSIKGTAAQTSTIHVVPGEVEFISQVPAPLKNHKKALSGVSSKMDMLASKKSIIHKFGVPKTVVAQAHYDIDDVKMTTPYDAEGRIMKRCPDCSKKYTKEAEQSFFIDKAISYEEAMDLYENGTFPKDCTVSKVDKEGKVTVISRQECDHIVGVTGFVDQYCYDGDKVNLSELLKANTRSRTLYDLDDIKERFYFCHKKGCGAPIDWEEIEKKLNT